MTSSHLPKNSCIELPQATCEFHRPLPKTATMLFLGGRAPSEAWAHSLLDGNTCAAICAVDRGVAICRTLMLSPDMLLGDADSATSDDWAWGEAHAKRIERHPVRKDLTDTQLALHRMDDSNTVLLLTGAFGGRFDHAYSTIFSAAQAKGTCVLADERESIAYVRAGETLSLHCHKQPKAISLLPMTSNVTGVTATGLYWPLADATLAQAMPNTVSNVLADGAHDCTISIQTGCLAVYACWVNR